MAKYMETKSYDDEVLKKTLFEVWDNRWFLTKEDILKLQELSKKGLYDG